MNYKKIKKLIRNPALFFRDYLNKRYPISHTELKVSEKVESVLSEYSDFNKVPNLDNIPVDVVFTWVDNQDLNWQTKYQQYVQEENNNLGQYATNSARFENHNELFFAIKAVTQNMKWVNKIYIVSDNQEPFWLSEFSNVVVIDHKIIIDTEYLPTFNSHVIEAFLHKIPNLSENFIYFNDDVFVAKELPKEHFFTANQLASLFTSSKTITKMQQQGLQTPTLLACVRSLELLAQYYPLQIDKALVHTYYPLKRSGFEMAWKLFEIEIRLFLGNRFRGNNDLNLATYLVPWLMYCNQQASEQIDVCYYFNIRSNNALVQYKKLLSLKEQNGAPHSFCANDFSTMNAHLEDYQADLINLLKKYYEVNLT